MKNKMKGARHKMAIAVLLLLLVLTLGSNLNANRNAQAQTGGPKYFEGDVPIQGAYLRAINTYPGVTPDSDSDGVLDKGCTWDDDHDGVGEQHVVVNPLIVNLEGNGFAPGDKIMISFKQSMYSTTWNYFAFYVYGLFSSSQALVSDDYVYTSSSGKGWPMVGPVNRVPGAIDAALGGYVHGAQDNTNSWKQGWEVENDIPQDFRIGGYQNNYGRNGDVWSQKTWWWGNCFWITIPPGAKFLFFQVAGAWNIGDAGYCKVTVDGDTDGDGIPDSWEKNGIDFNKDGATDLNLTGANWQKKDIFVEVDYMQGHRLNAVARDQVIAAFQNAPESINLHVEIDDADNIPHNDSIVVDAFTGSWPDFDTIKKDHFGSPAQRNTTDALKAKSWVYHYCLMIHNREYFDANSNSWIVSGSSGLSEPSGNDFIVSLGAFAGGVGTIEEQAGTFMHELGHNLGLQDGGGDNILYKPNYLSVMNYLFQTPSKQFTRPLDYSRGAQPTLNEKNLDEAKGIGSAPAAWPTTVFSAPVWNETGSYWRHVPLPVSTAGGIDWNNNGPDDDTGVQANLNHFPKWGYMSDADEPLAGYNDWANLRFNFQDTKDFADGVHSAEFGVDELTWDTVQAMRDSFSQLHEVAVLNVTSSSSVWQQGTVVALNLKLGNFGGSDETFNVTVYTNTTAVASASFVVKSENFTTVSLQYSVQTLSSGNYKLRATVNPVVNEIYTADNAVAGGVVTVTNVIPEFPPAVMLAVLITVTLAASLAFRRKQKPSEGKKTE